MTPDNFYARIVEPTLQYMAGPGINIPATAEARVMLMAIAGQESRWAHRRQIGGPARSYWQFEQGGGVSGVLNHPATALKAKAVCGVLDIESDIATVYEAMAFNDTLACCMARLLLWSDAAALPAVGDRDTAWDYYIRNWRPGAPHPESWPGVYEQARAAVGA
jgi:hypothetical protein